jgi:Rrf2 family protein
MAANSRYAVSVHILSYLAYQEGKVVPSAEIASSVGTNPVVIRRLLAALTKAGLVLASKGPAGGFVLARDPAAITLLDIQRAVEPKPTDGLAHFNPNPKCPVGARISAILHDVFGRARQGLEGELLKVNLQQIHLQLAPVCPNRKA